MQETSVQATYARFNLLPPFFRPSAPFFRSLSPCLCSSGGALVWVFLTSLENALSLTTSLKLSR